MKKTNRRQFMQTIQGAAGASLALPLFESLAGAVGTNSTSKAAKPAVRMAIYYVPMGVIRRGFFPGESEMEIPKFVSDPKAKSQVEHKVGIRKLVSLTATQKPLESVMDKVTFVSGCNRTYRHGSDVHAQCGSCFLSSATGETVASSIYPLDRTFDHVVADDIGGETPFRTLELSCNSHKDNKESIYFDNISWYGTGHVAPSIRDPRQAYDRLFGTKRMSLQRDITDLVLRDARSLQRKLGRVDREKFEEYFDGIRSIEQQMDKLSKLKSSLTGVEGVNVPDSTESLMPRGEYIRLMGDLMIAALQAGLTNVATMMIGPERWNTPYMFEGLFDKPVSHHVMSHNQKQFISELLKIDKFYMEQFVYMVQRMSAVREFDGSTLLDNMIFTYGSGLGDGATHQYTDLPIIVAGGGGGRLQQGMHLHCAEGTPLSNLWLTQARALGLTGDRFADSRGVETDLLK
ncbi:MAG: DUF1552 domain-containing protein [Planctomycetaceae bacterium]|jgi:hypothetical protein|nr:DUF1552 domain-containing protein [Planctomycetaceae bacterium]